MKVKKQKNSLTITENNIKKELGYKENLTLLIPGVLIMIGFFCMLNQEWNLAIPGIIMMIPSLIVMLFSMLLNWEKRWHTLTLLGILGMLLIVGIFYKKELAGSLAAFLEKFSSWKLLRTGIYCIPYEETGNIMLIVMLIACLIGFTIAQIIKTKNMFCLVIIVFPVLIGWMCNWLESGRFVAIYMMGALLLFVKFASGYGKAMYYSTVIVVIISLAITGSMWMSGFQANENTVSIKIERVLHSLRWENSKNPLPEGNISDFGAYRPQSVPALEVTMKKWTPLYLRGYVAGEYRNDKWQVISPEKIVNYAEDLYTIQDNYFFASDQIAKAWESVEKESSNTVNIQVLDACHANTYLPYGAGNLASGVLNPLELRHEGLAFPEIFEHEVDLYPVEESYLLQGELSKHGTTEYRIAESAYRDYVYDQYLTIPEDVYKIMTKYFTVDAGITTVQAKKSITKLLSEMITYNENIITDIGKKNFSEYAIEVSGQGYSVHYATLATLLMRCCGIPARYVEGYVITPQQAEMMPDGNKLTLTQYDSHAWTEYYLDGVGWLPFDATPGYENILNYELPEEGVPADNAGLEKNLNVWEQLKNKLNKKPLIEEEEIEKNQNSYIKEVLHFLLMLILVFLIVMFVRTIYLRHQLRKKLRRFNDQDYRLACAYILSYMQDLSKTLGKGTLTFELNARDQADRMASMLGNNFIISELEMMQNEIWFSDHSITLEHQKRSIGWLNTAQKTWNEKTSMLQKFKHRFITCKIL